MSGIKLDANKTRIDLFPGDVLFAISDILTFGAEKYAARNWEKGMKWGRVFAACMRHMWAWWQGQGPTNHSFIFGDLDSETGKSHLWHAGCCITFLIAYEMRNVGEDDRPQRSPDSEMATKLGSSLRQEQPVIPPAVIYESGGIVHGKMEPSDGPKQVRWGTAADYAQYAGRPVPQNSPVQHEPWP